MHVYKTLVDLVAAPDHAPYDFLKLELCSGSFFFSVTRLLFRTRLFAINDNSTHLLNKYHLVWREKSRHDRHDAVMAVMIFLKLFVDLFGKSLSF